MRKKLALMCLPLLMAAPSFADITIPIPDFTLTAGTPYVWTETVTIDEPISGLHFAADWTGVSGNPWSNEFEMAVQTPGGDIFDWDPVGGAGSGNAYPFDASATPWSNGVSSLGDWTITFNTSFAGSVVELANSVVTLTQQQMLSDYSMGTLYNGSCVAGNNGSSANIMNGYNGFGPGLPSAWAGGDDIYTLVWAGGDLLVDLTFTHADGDLDLTLWGDNAATVDLKHSATTNDNEQISLADLAAGTYYLHIDGWRGASNDYNLCVTPEPTSLALLALAGLAIVRRR